MNPRLTRSRRHTFPFSEPVHMMRSTVFSMAAVALLASPLAAQDVTADSAAAKPSQIPVRKLGPVEARTEQALGNVNTLRALPNGTLFVNDGVKRQILLFDGSLKIAKVVADTLEASIPYGQRNAGLLPYVGDSTLIVDPATLSLLVLNANGDMVRVMSAPRSQDLNTLAGANLGSNAFDSEGRLIYRTNAGGQFGGMGGGMMGGMGGPGGGFGGNMPAGGGRGGAGQGGQQGAQGAQAAQGGRGGQAATPPAGQQSAAEIRRQVAAVQEDRFPSGNSAQITVNGERRTRSFNDRNLPDSIPILRANFDTRKTDTVAFMRVTNPKFEMKATEDGGTQVSVKMNPLPQNDDWALLSDGTVAVVRVLDYRVDFIKPDGTRERSAPLPFDWKRISDEEKDRMVDSLKTASKEATERAQQMMGGGGGGRGGFRPAFDPVEAEFLPDYFPPIRAGSTLADLDGNLWILPTTSTLAAQMSAMIPANVRSQIPAGMLPAGMAADASGLAYDIVNRKGELVERVQVPAGRSIAGFGPNGVVYLLERKGRDVFLEKTRRVQQ